MVADAGIGGRLYCSQFAPVGVPVDEVEDLLGFFDVQFGVHGLSE